MSHLSTSNSEGQETGRTGIASFLGRILAFLFPFIIIGLALEFALWKTGDLWPSQYALTHQQQSTNESIYGPRFFSNQFNIFKLAGIRYRHPTILSIGSSRVMQIRDIMFHPLEKEFYNAGGLLRNPFDLDAFATLIAREELPLPKVLIVGIDPWWLRTHYNSGNTTWLNDWDERFSFAGHIEVFRQILKKGGLGEIIAAISASERPRFDYETIGTSARIDGTGFRKDGSNLYPAKIFWEFMDNPIYVDRELPLIINRIQKKRREFSLPAAIDEKRLRLIVKALALIQKKGVEVYAFMPPFSTEVFEAIESSQSLKPWWNFYKNAFPKLLEKNNISVVPVSHPIQFGLDDTCMFDGWHPSEVYMAHLVKSLIEHAPHSSYLKNVRLEDLALNIKNAAIPLAFNLPSTTTGASLN